MRLFEDYEKLISETAIYPEAGQGTRLSLAYTSLGLTGESGEVAEKIKKWIRKGNELDKRAVVKELGDVLWYVTATAKELGYSLQDVAQINTVKLLERKRLGVLNGEGDNRETQHHSV